MEEPSQPISFGEAAPDDDIVRAVEVNRAPSAPAAAPDWFGDPRLKSLDARQVIVERIAGWITVAVLATMALVLLVVLTVVNWPPAWGTGLVALGMLVVLSGLAWHAHAWPPIAYRWCRYVATEEGLEIYRGVLWRSVINVPRSRIQHTDVGQGPLQRRFGLSKLVVHTAGTQFAAIELDGLSREEALALRDLLTAGEAEHDAI